MLFLSSLLGSVLSSCEGVQKFDFERYLRRRIKSRTLHTFASVILPIKLPGKEADLWTYALLDSENMQL